VLEFKSGDILAERTDALVNAVNCVGVMGRGVALQFKQSFSANFEAYQLACRRKEVVPGRLFVFETGAAMPPRYVINFPTKRHWRERSRIEDIEVGLAALAHEIRSRRIRSVALPALGCGLGGLDWTEVRARIAHSLDPLRNVRIVVFEPAVIGTRIRPDLDKRPILR
jgi:O-acetyl-ADP-ribose deacetylase (regulator of RNase III)